MRYWVRSGVQKFCPSALHGQLEAALKPPLAKITGPNSLKKSSALLVDATSARTSTHSQLRDTRFCDDPPPRLAGLSGNLLHSLNQGTSDGHAWETLLASMDIGELNDCQDVQQETNQG